MDLGESLFDLTMELMPPVAGKQAAMEGDLIHNDSTFSKVYKERGRRDEEMTLT